MQPVEMMSWYGMIFGPLVMLIWLVVLIVVTVAVIQWLQDGSPGSLSSLSGRKRALEVLREGRDRQGRIPREEAAAFGLTTAEFLLAQRVDSSEH
jgi:uncharacterized membrane protein